MKLIPLRVAYTEFPFVVVPDVHDVEWLNEWLTQNSNSRKQKKGIFDFKLVVDLLSFVIVRSLLFNCWLMSNIKIPVLFFFSFLIRNTIKAEENSEEKKSCYASLYSFS